MGSDSPVSCPVCRLTAEGTALACNEVIHRIPEILQVEVFLGLQGGVLKQTRGVSQLTLNLGLQRTILDRQTDILRGCNASLHALWLTARKTQVSSEP